MEMPNMTPAETPKAIPDLSEDAARAERLGVTPEELAGGQEQKARLYKRLAQVAKAAIVTLGEPKGVAQAIKEAASNVINDPDFTDKRLWNIRTEMTRVMAMAFKKVVEAKIAGSINDEAALSRYGEILEEIDKVLEPTN